VLYNNACLLCYSAGGRFGGRGSGGRGNDTLVNRCIKIRSGPYKGYRGRVKELTGVLVRVELESLMKIVTGKSVASVLFFKMKVYLFLLCLVLIIYLLCEYIVKREDIGDTAAVATPFR